MSEPERLEGFRELDTALADVAGGIRILAPLQWPAATERVFLERFRAGRPELPVVVHEPRDPAADVDALRTIRGRCDRGHPVGNLLYKTARSYEDAARMLGALGKPEFTECSSRIYGTPRDQYRHQSETPLSAADFFLETTDRLLGGDHLPLVERNWTAADLAASLRPALAAFFTEDEVVVELDPDLASKAVAGSTRIRLREGAMFSALDRAQLLEHEAYVHAATSLNGRKQQNLRCLGLGSPRTTRTQEGLAVLAELLTLSIDVHRLRRVALRVRAIAEALDGADFLDVFRGFLDAGQTEEESFRSAQRVFRGGDVRGRIAFTKDSVYLKGMLEVHTFLRVAVRDNRPELVRALFAGRMTLGDVVELAPLFESGWLRGPAYLPPWASDLGCVGAVLAYSAFVNEIRTDAVSLEGFVRLEEQLARGE